MRSITLLSNGKINLFFSINGLRSDNYCDVSSIILPVRFGDRLTFAKVNPSPNTPPVSMAFHGPFQPDPLHNTIRKAIDLFCEKTKINVTLKVDVHKRIPLGSGFAGGSSNGIATLRALNFLYDNALPLSGCVQIAEQIGIDGSFFIQNCPQLATERGDILSPLAQDFCKKLSSYHVLLFVPTFSISTQWAYDQWKKNPHPYRHTGPDIPQLLATHDLENIPHNDFQELIFNHHGAMKLLFEKLQKMGYHPCITGSGSGGFIIHRDKNFLERAQSIIGNHWGSIPLSQITTFKV
ncbi:MAG: hypothetical protein LBN94_00450 [Puniceicoccales bacterium]|jgi:4-diphosphocytidyl-2-C-methyl-D-erythritol kinase|nr:hypothetical protein [Puniceicoccales bacterium]